MERRVWLSVGDSEWPHFTQACRDFFEQFRASRYAGMYVVTLSVDRVQFRQPVRVGELVTFFASVNYTGNTSMEVGIKVVSEDIHKGIATHTNSCFFTMVAVDDDGKPATVPPLSPATPDERRRHAAAEIRRDMRREMQRRFAAIHAGD